MIHLEVGQKFHLLTCLEVLSERSPEGRVMARWACECGQVKDSPASRVMGGTIKSCGCQVGTVKPNLKHGMRETPTYSSWRAAKTRSCVTTSKDFARYGAKGITMCPEWECSFEAFYRDMGERPVGTSLDRIDNRKGYQPDNCRWATDSEQQRNHSHTYTWIVKEIPFESMQEAADHFGVTKQTIARWVDGFFDKRRNTFTEKRNDCSKNPRY